MCKTPAVSIALAFAVGLCVVLAEKAREKDLVIHEPEPKIADSYSANNAANKESHCNSSELQEGPADECRCKNGKCMRACDVENTVPCSDKRKVCVCSPGFAETDGECQYCECGENFNCKFKMSVSGVWSKSCVCPEDYFAFNNRCKPKCSDERPCQNGGRCSYNTCNCPRDIGGDLCEQIVCSDCANRLEEDCLYDQLKETTYCVCKNSSLYYDYDARICIPCPCENGNCTYEINSFSKKLICDCDPGYKIYNGYCKKCDCNYNASCEFDSMGEKICECQDGYFEREGHCQTCDCTGNTDTDIKCKVTGNVKLCYCKEGFHDVLGSCEEINECETNNTCHPSTTCYNTYSSFYCQCPEGYQGSLGNKAKPGEICEDIDECEKESNACWYFDNVACINLPGSYKCECYKGYKPSNYDVEPSRTICVESRKSWWPAATVVIVTVALIGASVLMHIYVKKRSASCN